MRYLKLHNNIGVVIHQDRMKIITSVTTYLFPEVVKFGCTGDDEIVQVQYGDCRAVPLKYDKVLPYLQEKSQYTYKNLIPCVNKPTIGNREYTPEYIVETVRCILHDILWCTPVDINDGGKGCIFKPRTIKGNIYMLDITNDVHTLDVDMMRVYLSLTRNQSPDVISEFRKIYYDKVNFLSGFTTNKPSDELGIVTAVSINENPLEIDDTVNDDIEMIPDSQLTNTDKDIEESIEEIINPKKVYYADTMLNIPSEDCTDHCINAKIGYTRIIKDGETHVNTNDNLILVEKIKRVIVEFTYMSNLGYNLVLEVESKPQNDRVNIILKQNPRTEDDLLNGYDDVNLVCEVLPIKNITKNTIRTIFPAFISMLVVDTNQGLKLNIYKKLHKLIRKMVKIISKSQLPDTETILYTICKDSNIKQMYTMSKQDPDTCELVKKHLIENNRHWLGSFNYIKEFMKYGGKQFTNWLDDNLQIGGE